MSAAGAVREMVEAVVGAITGTLHEADRAQDLRLADLERRVTDLESRAVPVAQATRKAPAARTKDT